MPAAARQDARVVRTLHRFVAFASVLSAAIGLLDLMGWTLGVRLIPGPVSAGPGAALALMLSGASLWLLRTADGDRPAGAPRHAGRVLAGVVAAAGLVSLSAHLAGAIGETARAGFPGGAEDGAAAAARGLMAPLAAVDFAFLGLALFGIDWRPVFGARRHAPAQFLAFAANTGAIVGLLDAVLESRTSYTQMAPPIAAGLFVCSVAVACARTGWGLGALVASASDGGLLTRWLWPAAVGVPLLIGSASWTAHSAGGLSEWSAIVVMIVAMITALAGLTVWSGQAIDRGDAERRLVEGSLHRSEEELREAQRLARLGSWWWVPKTDTIAWSDGLFQIAGRAPRLPPRGFREHAGCYTPASADRLTAAVERAVREGTPFSLDLELVRPDGATRSVTSRGEAERDAEGNVALVRGTVQDVTEQKQAEAALRESEASLSKAQAVAHVGSWYLDVRKDTLSWSDEVFRIFETPPGTPLGYDSFLAAIHPADRQAVDRAWNAAMQGAPYDIEHRIVVPGGRVKWVRERAEIELDRDGRALRGVGTVQDITERKRAREELIRLNRALRALSRCNEALMRATEESAWLQDVCRIVVDEAGYRLCWVGRAEHDEAKTVTAVGQAGVDEGYVASAGVTWADTDRGRGPAGTCIRTARTQIVRDVASDPGFRPWRAEALRRGYASVLSIPVAVGGQPFGALSIYAAEPDAFSAGEVALLTDLASDLAFGIEALRTRAERQRAGEEIRALNAELEQRVVARTADLEAAIEREARTGFRIQQMLLLTQPPTDVPGLEVAAVTMPSRRIDGDFYDFFRHENQTLDVIVADVMGKGVPAALLAAATKSNFLEALCHLIAMSRSGRMPEPKEIVTLAHADMVRHLIELESFVTLSYARFDPDRGCVDLVDCGHTGMIVLRAASGACEIVHGDNMPLGIREGEIFEQMSVTFEPGDLFLFYSDGITDIRNPAGEFYGADRLSDFVLTNRGLGAQALVDAIRKRAVTFAGTDRLTDDLTCVAVRAGGAPRPLAHAELEIRSSLGELCRVRAFVRNFCRMVPPGLLDDRDVTDLELAVNEAASNIMKHAYHGRADQRIGLNASAFGDRIAFRLHHVGDAFDPASIVPPALDGSRESGFGVYLIGRSVDEVRYVRDDLGRHCVDLVKRTGASTRERPPWN